MATELIKFFLCRLKCTTNTIMILLEICHNEAVLLAVNGSITTNCTRMTWIEAKIYCLKRGGQLLENNTDIGHILKNKLRNFYDCSKFWLSEKGKF